MQTTIPADPAAWLEAARPYCAFRVRLSLCREGTPTTYPSFTSSRTVARFFGFLQDADREMFFAALLDTRQRLTGINLVSVGTLDTSLVHPREVYKPAIVGNAASILCVHNHPSADPTPSAEDHEITRRLAEAGRLLGIPLLDHVIVGAGGYLSFRDRGHL